MPFKEHDLLYSLGESELEKLVKDKPGLSLFLEALREYNIEMELFQRVPEEELVTRVSQNPITLSSVFDRLEKYSNGRVEDALTLEPVQKVGGAGMVCAMPKLIAGSKATTIQDPNWEKRVLESQVRTFRRWALINFGVAATGSTLALATPAMEKLLLQRNPLAFASLTHMAIYSASVIAAAGIGVNCTRRMDRIRSGEEAEYLAAQDSLPWYSRYWKKLTRNAIFPAIALIGLGAGMIRQSTAYYWRYGEVKKYEQKVADYNAGKDKDAEMKRRLNFVGDYLNAKRAEAFLSGKQLADDEYAKLAQEGDKAYEDYKAGKIPYPKIPEKPKKFHYLLDAEEILHPKEYLFSPSGTTKLWTMKQYFTEYGEKVDENVGRELHQLLGQKEAEFFTASKEMLFGEVELLMALYNNLGNLDKLNKKVPLSVAEVVEGIELQDGGVYDPRRQNDAFDALFKERLLQSFLKPLLEKLNESHGNLEDALASFVYTEKEIEAAKADSWKESIACATGKDEKRCNQSLSQQYDFYQSFLPDESQQKARLKEGLKRRSFVWKVLSEATALRRYHQALHNMRQQNTNNYLKISSMAIPQQSTGVTYTGYEDAPNYAEQKARCLQEFEKTSLELRIGNQYNAVNPGQHTSLYISEHEHAQAVPAGRGLVHLQVIVKQKGQPTPVPAESTPALKERNFSLTDNSFSVPDLGLEVWYNIDDKINSQRTQAVQFPLFTPPGEYSLEYSEYYGEAQDAIGKCKVTVTTTLKVTNLVVPEKK